MVVIGITGPTGAGKTTALNELKKLGGAMIDCDEVYHDLLNSDFTLQNNLISRFGDITDGTGAVDRKKLGAIVFADPEALETLNRIVHQAITQRVRELVARFSEDPTCPAAAIDAIALFESGLDRLCHTTLAITAPAETRVRRIMEREGISEEYAWSRVKAQRPDSYYTDRSRYVLVNDCGSREEFAQRAETLFRRILSLD